MSDDRLASEDELPLVVSVDDHVIEPPNVWVDRLPARYRDVGPRIERLPAGELTMVGGRYQVRPGTEGPPADYWHYEDLLMPQRRIIAAVGFEPDEIGLTMITYDDMRPGCYDAAARLDDMTANHTEASLCFPSFPRFCGQTFLEADDRELALLCVRAYNDWMVEEWCAGTDGRLIPLCLVPLWDVGLAAEEVRRNAARGVRAVAFCEIPAYLGLPSVHDADRYWDPFFAACAETDTVVCMHIGSSSRMPTTSDDAPPSVGASLSFNNAIASLTDYLFSGVLVRFPELSLAYSEGQIGWIPYILERCDEVWEQHGGWTKAKETLPEPPSHYYYRQVFGCFFRDKHGIDSLDVVGPDNVTFETDYPHTDSTWPNTKKVAYELMGHLPRETVRKLVRGNAIRMLSLDLAP
jgi:predicted TIM-barrel fold metal-dependent hydrolase